MRRNAGLDMMRRKPVGRVAPPHLAGNTRLCVLLIAGLSPSFSLVLDSLGLR